MAQETVRYTFRLRPGGVAVRQLLREAGMTRWVWNRCMEVGKRKEEKLTVCGMSKRLTKWRAEFDWLAEGSSVVQQQTTRMYASARQAAFKIKGRCQPKFKSKKTSRPSLEYTLRGFCLAGERLQLAGGITIPVVWSRRLPSDPTSVRVYQDAVGDWFASFVVRRAAEQLPQPGGAIGIDWGVKAIATTTNPAFDLPHAQHGKASAERLSQCQRKVARRRPKRGQKGSNRYFMARRETAKTYRKVARQRKDMGVKWAVHVVVEHSKIAVEDFKPKFLAKTTMARKAADATIGAIKRELITCAKKAGRTVVLVPPAYTTMTCSNCGTIAKSRLELSQRTFECSTCGYTAGRDFNAARTILVAAGFNGACVENVRQVVTA